MLLELKEAAEHEARAVLRSHLPEGKRTQASEQSVLEALRQLGKTEPALEYNCGACGYHTCREKASAVALGRAELEMCLPFMRAKAESLSNLILASTPNAIVVVDKELCVQEWNAAAERMFGVPASLAKGKRVGEFLPEEHFVTALSKLESSSGLKLSPMPALITALSVVPVRGGDLVMGIYSDITEMEEQGKALDKLRQETVDKAQEVINKQMRVAQDIASLLGETTAESKMLLLKLMRVVQGEKA
ncbi:MAG: Electron transport complex subunit RsxB [Firmicutes bacterium]|nr:Electron transport complex subunit RsxB [Bacillota bacterium]